MRCGGRIQLGTQASVRSPGYPSNYPNNLDCIWTITAPSGSTIMLEFVNLDIEPCSSSCNCDYVTVHDGASEFTDRLGSKVCKTVGTGSYNSTSNKMTVFFHTQIAPLTNKALRLVSLRFRMFHTIVGYSKCPQHQT